MNYYIQGNAAKAEQIKAAFEKKGIDVLDFGFADKTVAYCSIGGCVQSLPYSINLMHILYSHPDYKELPVQSKFKVGDWLVYKDGDTFAGGFKEVQVKTVEEINRYTFTHNTNGSCNFIDRNCRLWNIQDAKDGDVLATDNGWTCIFKAFDGCGFSSYCFMDSQRWFCEVGSELHTLDSRINGNIHPATKEQRDLLFAKMREAGYEWDANKKELRKIQPHYDIANFQPFDKVLVRYYSTDKWKCGLFSHLCPDRGAKFVCVGALYSQCIPFNKDTKHLLGTTDMCDEQYINW